MLRKCQLMQTCCTLLLIVVRSLQKSSNCSLNELSDQETVIKWQAQHTMTSAYIFLRAKFSLSSSRFILPHILYTL